MSDATVVLILVALGTYALKAAGPLVLGQSELPPWLTRVTDLMPACLIAALVVTSGVGGADGIVIDARLVGLAAAGIALYRRAPFVVVVLLACVATALARLVT